ncbi:MAG: F0F1 ATP synthase subunit gamma [Magnetococcales bacterium]|nr:F0F1 ATP synthase subunit gamma [Magnetococcales bacterium]
MASLKALRRRLRSVNNTRQITKAMKMVAAAKLRRAQNRAISARPYSLRMGRMVQSLASRVEGRENLPELLAGRPDGNRVELVICTADRGLCGSFNSSVIRAVRVRIAELQKNGMTVSLTFLGRKGNDVLKRQYGDMVRKVHFGLARHLNFRFVEEHVTADLLQSYQEGKFDACFLVFNTFQSAMQQVVTWRQLIPAPVDKAEAEANSGGSDLYEPSEEELLDELLPRNVSVQIHQALVESEASEHGARMSAMDSAVRNANEMIRKLNTTYNRTRQAFITKELMEIIGGAESLKG